MNTEISFTLNTRQTTALVAPYEDAVDLLHRLSLFGARESCGQGMCGCCTILVNGMPVSGCLTLALKLDGATVETIESLEIAGELHPVQQAFIDESAFQCGFCTPGFVLMARQLLAENPRPQDHEIREYLAGNLCRCAAYPEIVRAVQSAARRMASASA